MKPTNVIAVVALMAAGISAQAQSHTGNGGKMIFKDGKAQLADPFMNLAASGTTMHLSKTMRKYLGEIRDYLKGRGMEIEPYFKNVVLSDLVEFNYVDKLQCPEEATKTKDGQVPVDYGCTKNGVTEILKANFEQLSTRSQALGIIHERLHALNPTAPHHWIWGFIAGLQRTMELHDEQLQGKHWILTEEDYELVKGVYINAKRLGINSTLYPKEGYLVCILIRTGGGIVCTSAGANLNGDFFENPANGIYVDLGSSYNQFDGEFGTRFSIIDSSIDNSLIDDSEVVNSSIYGSTITSKSKVTGSTVFKATVTHTEINDSNLESFTAEYQIKDSLITHSKLLGSERLHYAFGKTSIDSSKVDACSFTASALTLTGATCTRSVVSTSASFTAKSSALRDSSLKFHKEQMENDSSIELTDGSDVKGLNSDITATDNVNLKLKFAGTIDFSGTHPYKVNLKFERAKITFRDYYQTFSENVGSVSQMDAFEAKYRQ